ncbi:MAG TPA: nucleoside-diphosphate kinase [Clostridiaceae bacterium]
MEKTLILIKPDGVERKIIGEIISFYERKNLLIKELKLLHATREQAENHYTEHKGRPYYEGLINFLVEGYICALVLEGEGVIELVRKINGDKDPLKAEIGSIRGTFTCDKSRNLVHSSDSIESANREINIWFS